MKEADQIVPNAVNHATVAPRRVDEVEEVEIADWVSGWLATGSMGVGYARLAKGPLPRS